MSKVEFEEVTKLFGDGTRAVDKLDLQIDDGEFMVFVGPSGCGKTTALRMVAGLEDISGGVVRIGERVVNDLSPKSRDIAMVFQSYALYPHLSVRDNIAFPLKIAKVPKDEIRRRVDEAARILGLEPYLGRKPRALSGGQRQRVAMGRAIVREPAVFLLDEPLSNLDAKLRVQMRADIKKIQHDLGTTTIYVTHDQVEAMTMGDRVAVMRKGELQQVAPPQELYDRPREHLRRRLHRQPGDEHARGSVERERRGVTVVLGDSRLEVDQPRSRSYVGQDGRGRTPPGEPRGRLACERLMRAGASEDASNCVRRSGRRCSSTSRSPGARQSPRTCATWPRTSVTTAFVDQLAGDGIAGGDDRRPVRPADNGVRGRCDRRLGRSRRPPLLRPGDRAGDPRRVVS